MLHERMKRPDDSVRPFSVRVPSGPMNNWLAAVLSRGYKCRVRIGKNLGLFSVILSLEEDPGRQGDVRVFPRVIVEVNL